MEDVNKMKRIFIISLAFLFLITLVSADSMENFSQAEKLINQGVSCDQLTVEQLELIGDYYMEQMHPGEAHEYMDQMMGGEGSESLRQVHITIAKRVYCNETNSLNYRSDMMGYNGYGMMGNYYNNGRNNIFIWIFNIILIVGLVLLIILLVKQLQRKNTRR